MARNIDSIAAGLGATVVARLPEIGGGAFGAARLAGTVAALKSRLASEAQRPAERSDDADWVLHPKIPMSDATRKRLERLARRASAGGHRIGPMQIAAQILEEALADVPEP